ncbi:hypothetical protein [Planctomicrobium sp. SH664]|uniref:hypothetical protein n=1 Tax=Planctomicrobium sp. SH664 TaxID=3448125 RepID=UPI003F5C2784
MLDNNDYWVLDAVATGGVRLEVLLGDPEVLKVNWFVEPHAMTRRDLEARVIALAGRGLIEIVLDEGGGARNFVRMTAAGGATWESWAQPLWHLYCEDLYLEDFTYSADSGERIRLVEINATNESRLFDAIYRLSLRPHEFVVGIAEIKRVSPWRLWGWKTLDSRVTTTILLQSRFSPAHMSLPSLEGHRHFRRWRKQGFDRSECFELITDQSPSAG